MTDLSDYARRARRHAPAGGDGAGGRKTGRQGADLVLDVPVGTVVLDQDGALIADLDRAGAREVIVAGGAGGRGNVHFKSSTRQAPEHAEPGEPGEERTVVLDLKLIADVGLVGPPNAGKSSLLRALTAAQPKVADYPFTTLDPELGVMVEGDRRLVLADIPGLIEGASSGAGLGHKFLRHVERTRVLTFVVDGAAPDPWAGLQAVRAEVAAFSPGLGARPHIVAVNKVDLEVGRELRARSRRKGILFVSALTGEGLVELRHAMLEAVERAPAPELPPRAAVRLPARAGRAAPVAVAKLAWGFDVRGDRVERLVAQTNFDSAGAVARFQVELDKLGVNEALEAAGAQPGDTVRVGASEFEYQP